MSIRTGPLTSFSWRWCLASGLGGAVAGWLEGSGWQFSATLLLLGFTVGLAQNLCWVGFRSPVGLPQVVGSHPRLGWRWLVITGMDWIVTGWVGVAGLRWDNRLLAGSIWRDPSGQASG
ncbi:hypothetical protein [Thermostichus vulcanus]|uniref:Uncharacterized protein n=1 Tax=Thermostichus vulcanus str. 'Rupite' TaxID=2813851 RepID=A0ABT0CC47_THEVL|nr:hypothetical protein [Thermostichus vulcanus]MCJ2543368.1 hypothetical protein [Thermostichus vulcanus str. 'Rupite']